MAKVIASSIRKGNVLEVNGGLYTVLAAENFFPGKGTPTTQIDMRRLSDGIKTTQRYRTTEQVERAFVEELEFSYLYQDGTDYVFMNPESFEQLSVPGDMLGEQLAYLQEGMVCTLSIHEGVAVAIQLPQRVTLEVTETEPTVKGQTASSSYKPAIANNGVRIMIPPYMGVGEKIVVDTSTGEYVRRAD